MRTTSEVVCFGCGKKFLKPDSEIKRSKSGRHFCDLKCVGKVAPANLPQIPKGGEMPKHLKADNRRDAFSPFRFLLRTAKMHSIDKNNECSITVEELKCLWEQQQGKCPYTGWELELPKNTKHNRELKWSLRKASLDRKNPNKGYVPGNVQFVAMIANFAKNRWSDTQLLEFATAMVRNFSPKPLLHNAEPTCNIA